MKIRYKWHSGPEGLSTAGDTEVADEEFRGLRFCVLCGGERRVRNATANGDRKVTVEWSCA